MDGRIPGMKKEENERKGSKDGRDMGEWLWDMSETETDKE